MQKKREIVIVGVGNTLMGDEGVGCHAIVYLQKFTWPKNCELIDAGCPGASLLYLLEDRTHAVIIDCADFGGQPGAVATFAAADLQKSTDQGVSLHGMSLLGTLALAEALQIKLPPVDIIGVQPQTIALGPNLSPLLEKSLPEVHNALRIWGTHHFCIQK